MSLSFSWTEYADGRIFVAQPDQKPREAIGHEAEILRKLRDLNVELEAANGVSELRLDDAREFKRERDDMAKRYISAQLKATEEGVYAGQTLALLREARGILDRARHGNYWHGTADRLIERIDVVLANPVNEIGTKREDASCPGSSETGGAARAAEPLPETERQLSKLEDAEIGTGPVQSAPSDTRNAVGNGNGDPRELARRRAGVECPCPVHCESVGYCQHGAEKCGLAVAGRISDQHTHRLMQIVEELEGCGAPKRLRATLLGALEEAYRLAANPVLSQCNVDDARDAARWRAFSSRVWAEPMGRGDIVAYRFPTMMGDRSILKGSVVQHFEEAVDAKWPQPLHSQVPLSDADRKAGIAFDNEGIREAIGEPPR